MSGGPPVAAPAGGASPAVVDEVAPKANMVVMGLNLLVLYFVYTSFSSSSSSSASSPSSSSGQIAVAVTPTPTPASSVDPNSPFYFLELIKQSSTGKRKVAPELQEYEDDRVERLDAAKNRGTTSLHNIWPLHTPFEIYVYLSERADPIDVFSMTRDPRYISSGLDSDNNGNTELQALPAPSADSGSSLDAVEFDDLKEEEEEIELDAEGRVVAGAKKGAPTTSSSSDKGTNSGATAPKNLTFVGLFAPGAQYLEDDEEDRDEGRSSSSSSLTTEHAPPLFWHQKGLRYDMGDSNNEQPTGTPAAEQNENNAQREEHFNIALPPHALLQNGSVYAHIFMCAAGASPDPLSPRYSRSKVIQIVQPLVKWLKVRPKKRTVNLLTGEGDEKNETAAAPKQAMFGIGLEPEVDTRRKAIGGGSRSSGDDDDDGEGTGEGTGAASDTADVFNAWSTALTAVMGGEVSTQPAPVPSSTVPVVQPLSYWKPTLHLQLIVDHSKFPIANLPPHVTAAMDVEPLLGGYKPHTYINEFWLLNHHLSGPLNATVPVVPFTISYSPQSMWKWALQSQMQASWDAQAAMGTSGEGETDLLKSIITDANPYLLIVTGVVSVLHMIFEFLAFKNDISFWRGAKSLEGLSVRSLTINFVQMLIITLYLFENETSWMILFTQVTGLGIEIWKLRKAMSVSFSWKGWRPHIAFADKDEKYATSRTKEYDDIATHHMLIVLAPLVVGYALYSLFYDRHRSWYSWLVTSAVNYVYMFGFVQLVPQLYINYRLKSVAHMPFRVHVYRFFNTIIDDLFAFVIKMPTLHRISVFRDDVIFLCLLGQRWYYPMDATRKNEYGTSKLDEEIAASIKRGEARVCRRGKYLRREDVTAIATSGTATNTAIPAAITAEAPAVGEGRS